MTNSRKSRMIIFGAGEQAETLHFYFSNYGDYSVDAFVLDEEFIEESVFCGCPVITPEVASKEFSAATHDCYVAIGYSKLNRLRTEKYKAMKSLGYHMTSFISEKATILADEIGEHTVILEGNTLQPFVKVAENVVMWSNNHIGHHTHVAENCYITSHIVCSGGVQIGRNTFIGVNVTLRDHIKIGASNLIGAGALILGDTEDDALFRVRGTPKSERLKPSDLRNI